MKELLMELIVKEINKRQDYTWIWQGEPLRMYNLPYLKEGGWIAAPTNKQAYKLGKMAKIKESLRSDKH